MLKSLFVHLVQIKEGDGIDINIEYTQAPLKLFLVYPGDEIFLCLEMFPYKADIKPVDISPQQWSEKWISLEIKTAKPDWKLETQLSCKWTTKNKTQVPI